MLYSSCDRERTVVGLFAVADLGQSLDDDLFQTLSG